MSLAETVNCGPAVIACGYRHIQSHKTSLSFPAWLVRLPLHDNDGKDGAYWWRSKRDFLCLGRAAARSLDSPLTRRLPKAAMEKLSKRSPWQRPSLNNEDDLIRHPHLLGSCKDGSHNLYHASMKKSILQMDQFLQAVYQHVLQKPNDNPLVVAWREFCQSSHTAGLMEYRLPEGDETLENNENARIQTTSLVESSRLGQYFCTEENAVQLVTLVLDWIQKQGITSSIVFVEPSCGHGQVIWKLVDELKKRDISQYTIVACDLDPHAIHVCQQHEDAGNVSRWICGDFLTTTTTAATTDTELEMENATESTVICLGGPPYTSGAGSGSELQRDLPQLFLSHCQDVWKATFVAFFLPRRCHPSNHPLRLAPNWNCTTYTLTSSEFYFQGSTKVTQPSVLQCFSES